MNHNKRFKTDSQRVAFVVYGKCSDLGGVQKERFQEQNYKLDLQLRKLKPPL